MIDTALELNELTPLSRIPILYEMALDVWDNNNVLALLTVTQAVLESAILRPKISGLAGKNNLFGIKGKGTAGESTMSTTEVIAGQMVLVHAGFAMNLSLRDSFEQHKTLLTTHSRYQRVVNSVTIKQACELMGDSGYATDPKYGRKLYNVYIQNIYPALSYTGNDANESEPNDESE